MHRGQDYRRGSSADFSHPLICVQVESSRRILYDGHWTGASEDILGLYDKPTAEV